MEDDWIGGNAGMVDIRVGKPRGAQSQTSRDNDGCDEFDRIAFGYCVHDARGKRGWGTSSPGFCGCSGNAGNRGEELPRCCKCNKTEMKAQGLIEAVEERRHALGWTDEALARALGISRPLWSQVRSGKRRVTLDVVRGILRAFPDLEAQVMEYLKEAS